MYQTNIVKGKVASEPKVKESETLFYVKQANPVEGRPNDFRMFLVHYKGKKSEIEQLKSGETIFIVGELMGDQYGRPFIYAKDNGEQVSVFEIETFKVYRNDEDFAFTLLLGNLGKDPDSRYLDDQNATLITSSTFATNKSWKVGGDWQKSTIWWRITTWREQAERAMQVWKKGAKLFIMGVLAYDSVTGGPRIWERTTQDGEKVPAASYELTAYKFISLQKSENNGHEDGPAPVETHDDIPW